MVKLRSDAVPTRFKMAKIPSNGSLMEEHNTMTHSGSELLVKQEMEELFVNPLLVKQEAVEVDMKFLTPDNESSMPVEINKHQCNLCEYKTSKKQTLLAHVRGVHEGVKFECDQCDYKASFRSSLHNHKKAKHKVQNINNKILEEMMYESGTSFMSLENVSTEVMIKSIVIDIVNVISGNELKAEQVDTNDEFHVAKKIKLDKNTDMFQCDQCVYTSSSKQVLLAHRRGIHEGVTYDCDECDYKASFRSSLKTHKNAKHLGLTYQCDVCNKMITSKTNLNKHDLELLWGLLTVALHLHRDFYRVTGI